MARVLLDACVPHRLRHLLAGFDVETARFAGLDTLEDQELLKAIAGRYDVLVTLDRGIPSQSTMAGRLFGLAVLVATDQQPETSDALAPRLAEALRRIGPGEIIFVE